MLFKTLYDNSEYVQPIRRRETNCPGYRIDVCETNISSMI